MSIRRLAHYYAIVTAVSPLICPFGAPVSLRLGHAAAGRRFGRVLSTLLFSIDGISNANLSVYLFNKGRFVLDILLNIVWIERCAFFFDPTVCTHRFRIGAQIVPEGNVPF